MAAHGRGPPDIFSQIPADLPQLTSWGAPRVSFLQPRGARIRSIGTRGGRSHIWRKPATCFGNLMAWVWFYLSHSQCSKFLTSSFAKGLQHIDGPAVPHVLQFG